MSSLCIDKTTLLSLAQDAGDLYLPRFVPRLISPPSPLVFLRNYVMPNLPVVIEQGVSQWPAIRKWTKQYLLESIGEKTVTVAITPNGYADATIGKNFVLPDEKEMKFRDFLQKLKLNKKGDEILYIQKQNSSFLDEFSELIPDAASEIEWASEAFGKKPDAVNFWMGSEHSVTSMHKDHYENMYAVVSGSKTFLLHPPSDLPCIPYEEFVVCRFKKNIKTGEYEVKEEVNLQHCDNCYVETDQKDVIGITDQALSNLTLTDIDTIGYDANNTLKTSNTMDDNHENGGRACQLENVSCSCMCECHHKPNTVPWVAIDPLDPDYKKYPEYRAAHPLQVTLYPGDVLYLPSLWFHHVQQGNDTIAVNFWYDMEYDIKYNYFKFVETIVHGNKCSNS